MKDAVYMQGELAKVAKAGTPAVEVTKALHKFQDEHGYKRSDGLFGHGQGYDMSCRPTFSYDETMILQENMFVSIHPQMATANVFAFNTDNFIITKGRRRPCQRDSAGDHVSVIRKSLCIKYLAGASARYLMYTPIFD